MTTMEWIALAGLIFTIGSAFATLIARGFRRLERELRAEAAVNNTRHVSNTNRLTRIETKLNIIGNGSVAHLPGPED